MNKAIAPSPALQERLEKIRRLVELVYAPLTDNREAIVSTALRRDFAARVLETVGLHELVPDFIDDCVVEETLIKLPQEDQVRLAVDYVTNSGNELINELARTVIREKLVKSNQEEKRGWYGPKTDKIQLP